MRRRIFAEFLGTAILLCAVVGSGIMATQLTQDIALQLLANTLVTVFVLAVIISIFAEISSAHFNPIVTFTEYFYRRITLYHALQYAVAQFAGAVSGVVLAHAMFDLELIQSSTKPRGSTGLFIGEIVATAGLILIIQILNSQKRGNLAVFLVPSWIGGAYFFTSSTSFANPAATVGRSLTDSFSGIESSSVINFIIAQCLGGVLGVLATLFLYPRVQK